MPGRLCAYFGAATMFYCTYIYINKYKYTYEYTYPFIYTCIDIYTYLVLWGRVA